METSNEQEANAVMNHACALKIAFEILIMVEAN